MCVCHTRFLLNQASRCPRYLWFFYFFLFLSQAFSPQSFLFCLSYFTFFPSVLEAKAVSSFLNFYLHPHLCHSAVTPQDFKLESWGFKNSSWCVCVSVWGYWSCADVASSLCSAFGGLILPITGNYHVIDPHIHKPPAAAATAAFHVGGCCCRTNSCITQPKPTCTCSVITATLQQSVRLQRQIKLD